MPAIRVGFKAENVSELSEISVQRCETKLYRTEFRSINQTVSSHLKAWF